MQSLVSLQAYPADLREYLCTHRIPTVYEVSKKLTTNNAGAYSKEHLSVKS